MGSEWIPGVVASSTGNVNYKILTSDSRLLHRHVDQVIPRSSAVTQNESSLLPAEVISRSSTVTHGEPSLLPAEIIPVDLPSKAPIIPVDLPSKMTIQEIEERQIVNNDTVVADAPAERNITNIVNPVLNNASSDVPPSSVAAGRPRREGLKPLCFRDEQ